MGCGELARNQASTGRDRARWTYETSSDSELTAYQLCSRCTPWVLTLSERLDTLSVHRLPVLVHVCHQETPEVLLHRSADLVDGNPLPDRSSLDISEVLQAHFLQSALHHSKILLALTGSPSASSSFGLSSYCLLRRLVSMPDNSPSPNVSSWSSLCKNPGMWSLRPARRPGSPRSRLSIARSAASRSARLISCTEERSSMSACEYVSSAALLS